MISVLPARFRGVDDPRSRAVIAALDAVGDGRSTVVLPEVDPDFRSELRAQLVAVAPRLIAEGDAPPATPARHGRVGADAPAAPVRKRRSRRPMTVLISGAAVVVLGLGGATYLSRDALPGDALYGLKRTAERVDVSLSGNDVDKGHTLLVDAQTRVAEASALLSRPQSMAFAPGHDAAGGISDRTITLIVDTLGSADADTHQGVATISDQALTSGNTAGLQLVVAWAQGQRDRIDALVQRVPAGTAAATRAATSAAEIRTGLARATAMLAQVQQHVTCTNRGRDAFGPEPCAAS